MKNSLHFFAVVLTAIISTSAMAEGTLIRKPGVKYTNEVSRFLSRPMIDEASSSVTYHGGPVISNAKVVNVFWGSKNIDPMVTAGTGPFYKAMFDSTYYDWLNEYDTMGLAAAAGHGQRIGKGTYAGDVTISPKTTSGKLQDSEIQKELASQIKAGSLPAPDVNTVYMINFPKGLTIEMEGSQSCADFCAYHNSFTVGQSLVLYGVMPDSSAASCIKGCGPAINNFEVVTTDASHELAEVITDPDVNNSNPHFAWLLSDNSEIGDPEACFSKVADITDASGAKFQVQSLWSGKRNACVFGPQVSF